MESEADAILQENLRTADILVRDLRKQIESGNLRGKERLPSERTIADTYRVSKKVARNAVLELERLGIVERSPNRRPLILSNSPKSNSRSGSIAIWKGFSSEEFAGSSILTGAISVCNNEGLDLVVGSLDERSMEAFVASESAFLRRLKTRNDVLGLIYWCVGGEQSVPAIRELQLTGMPIVFVDRKAPRGIRADLVATDNVESAADCVRHLIRLGHRRIVLALNEEIVSSVTDRRRGYEMALSEAGIPVDPALILSLRCGGRTLKQASDALIDEMRRLDDPATAIFAVNDQVALFLYESTKAAGLRIPKDISIVGFDWSLRQLPNGGYLTSASQSIFEIGRLAAKRVIELSSSAEALPKCQILLEAPLIDCGSTCPPTNARDLQLSAGEIGNSIERKV